MTDADRHLDAKTFPFEPRATRVVHCKRERHDVYIGRPGAWGNPYSHLPRTLAEHRCETREQAVAAYEAWIVSRLEAEEPGLREAIIALKGQTLGCWCAPRACHGDVLAALAESLVSA